MTTESITAVPGIRIGHAHDLDARTGCTVVLCEAEGAVAAVDVRGAAPGTRETDLLRPGNLVEKVHAICLSGGSVFGLDAACGVVRYLEENNVGFDTGAVQVPIVPAAVIYDLGVGDPRVRPDSGMGYQACMNATSEPAWGQVGAGAGATAGKILGPSLASASGIGSAAIRLRGGLVVGALVVANPFGDIVDPKTGAILAGAHKPDGTEWLDTARALVEANAVPAGPSAPGQNTTLAVVATNAHVTRPQAMRIAAMAHDGMARAIRPVHTMFDGDTVFALSTGGLPADVTTIGSIAADLVAAVIASVGRGQW